VLEEKAVVSPNLGLSAPVPFSEKTMEHVDDSFVQAIIRGGDARENVYLVVVVITRQNAKKSDLQVLAHHVVVFLLVQTPRLIKDATVGSCYSTVRNCVLQNGMRVVLFWVAEGISLFSGPQQCFAERANNVCSSR
jgi:hypothetical protein